MRPIKFITAFIVAINFSLTCTAQLFRPYKCGPVLKKSQIQTFDSLNQYLDIKSGDTFAEIGASSGYYDGAMAVYLEDVTFYLQDVDEECLNEENMGRLLKYYSKFKDKPIETSNTFHIAIGTETSTNLPKNMFDVIYCNATYHALNQPDSIIVDLYESLKSNGTLSIRDEFVMNGKSKFCNDKKCGNELARFEDFMNTMRRCGFELIGQSDQFGYPIYKFMKKVG